MSRYKSYVKSFSEAEEFLKGGRSKDHRPLENNTWLERCSDDEIAVRLHQTNVITFHRNGQVTVNSGGWHTVTTKDRINGYLPRNVRVYSDKGRWWIFYRSDTAESFVRLLPFEDGLTFDPDNLQVPSEESILKVKSEDRINDAARKHVEKYVRNITAEGLVKLIEEAKEHGLGGDCWYCAMQTNDGKSLGDAQENWDHLQDHIRTGYHMLSLYINALKEKGYPEPTFILQMEARTLGRNPSMTKAAVRRYLLKRLTVGAVAVR